MKKRLIIPILLFVASVGLIVGALLWWQKSADGGSSFSWFEDKPGRHFEQANRLIAEGDLRQAEDVLRGVIEKFPQTPDAAQAMLSLGDIAFSQRKWLEARSIYQALLESFPESPVAGAAQKQLGNANLQLLFSPVIVEGISEYYEVKPGDSLAKIARNHSTTVELIKHSNQLKSDVIHPGQRLKVVNKPFRLVVDKSQNTLSVLLNEELFKVYDVSTGKNNSTPVGEFTIVNKLENPVWYNAGAVVPPDSPENILGTRWMGWSKQGFGIHGTVDPDGIGQQVTAGCVRMRNEEVEELYTLIPRNATVVVMD